MIQTTTLETSKLLKTQGFRQDTEMYHYPVYSMEVKMVDDGNRPARAVAFDTDILRWEVAPGHEEDYFGQHKSERIAAPTTDELLEELPEHIRIQKYHAHYSVGYWHPFMGENGKVISGQLCECLAQMWLWLKKEGLIK